MYFHLYFVTQTLEYLNVIPAPYSALHIISIHTVRAVTAALIGLDGWEQRATRKDTVASHHSS